MRETDPFDLERFIKAQSDIHPRAIAELRSGRKTSHWMWFVFPQLTGLGHSDMVRRYGIRDLDEARAYLSHRVLGARLQECAEVLAGLDERLLGKYFAGQPDELTVAQLQRGRA